MLPQPSHSCHTTVQTLSPWDLVPCPHQGHNWKKLKNLQRKRGKGRCWENSPVPERRAHFAFSTVVIHPRKPLRSPPTSRRRSHPRSLRPKRKRTKTSRHTSTRIRCVWVIFNLHPNVIHSTRSLWGHFGRSPNVSLTSKDADAARSAPTGPPKLKSPKKLKHKASLFDFEKSPRKLKHKASAIDLQKSPRKLKNKASAIDIETAAAAARAATRRTAWLLPEDDESN